MALAVFLWGCLRHLRACSNHVGADRRTGGPATCRDAGRQGAVAVTDLHERDSARSACGAMPTSRGWNATSQTAPSPVSRHGAGTRAASWPPGRTRPGGDQHRRPGPRHGRSGAGRQLRRRVRTDRRRGSCARNPILGRLPGDGPGASLGGDRGLLEGRARVPLRDRVPDRAVHRASGHRDRERRQPRGADRIAGPHPRAADEARRRIQRDLHDGAQQRLVHTSSR